MNPNPSLPAPLLRQVSHSRSWAEPKAVFRSRKVRALSSPQFHQHTHLFTEQRATRTILSLTFLCCWLLNIGTALSDGAVPPVTAIAVAPGTQEILVGSQAGLSVRQLPALDVVRQLETELEQIHDLEFSPDGKTLVAVGGSPAQFGQFELYRWPSGELLSRKVVHEDVLYAVAWQTDSTGFAVTSGDNKVSVFGLDSTQPPQVIDGHSRSVLAAAFLSDKLGLVTGGIDESIRLWESGSGKLLRTLTNHTKSITGIAARPGTWPGPPTIATIGLDHTVRLWQPTIGRLMRFARLDSPPLDVCWLSEGKSIAVACKDGKVRVIDPDTIQVTAEHSALEGVAYCLGTLPDGRLIVGGDTGQLKLVQLNSEQFSSQNADRLRSPTR